jgi:large subunit ribosomal protein L4
VAKIDVYNLKNEKVDTLKLDDSVFGAEVKEHLFHEVVRAQRATSRSGSHKAKDRSERHGTNNKPFRQKGTGNARRGDVKSPLLRGGGVIHGPNPRNYGYRPPRKVRQAAVRCALSRRYEEQKLWVVEDFELEEIKTGALAEICANFGWTSALLVDECNDKLNLSARNLPTVQYLPREGLNTYDILRYEHLVLSKSALERITGALAK